MSQGDLRDARTFKVLKGQPCLQVVQTVKSAAMFYCATLHPEPAKENVVLAGASDKKIYQYDLNSGDMVQEYHYHLGAVNTISYIEENRMFVSTADDKTIRVWELGVPVQVKAIADPSMHSMPAAAYHPGGKFICFQSLDSQIVTYGTNGKFRVNKKKVFKGHLVGGNACQVRTHFASMVTTIFITVCGFLRASSDVPPPLLSCEVVNGRLASDQLHCVLAQRLRAHQQHNAALATSKHSALTSVEYFLLASADLSCAKQRMHIPTCASKRAQQG